MLKSKLKVSRVAFRAQLSFFKRLYKEIMRTMQRVTFPVNPGKGKHSALIMRSCFSSLLFSSFFPFLLLFFLTAFLCDSDESNSDIEAALRPQPLRTNADDFDDFADWFFFFSRPPLQISFFFFFVKKHYIISLKNIRQFELAVIHPVTITLVVCIVKRVRTVSQKQIIKLTALTLAKVREELSNTLMLTLLQSLYLNNSPGS